MRGRLLKEKSLSIKIQRVLLRWTACVSIGYEDVVLTTNITTPSKHFLGLECSIRSQWRWMYRDIAEEGTVERVRKPCLSWNNPVSEKGTGVPSPVGVEFGHKPHEAPLRQLRLAARYQTFAPIAEHRKREKHDAGTGFWTVQPVLKQSNWYLRCWKLATAWRD